MQNISRRHALELLFGTGAAVFLRCGGSTGTSDVADGGAEAGADATTTCAVTPEGEIGPYFADDSDPAFNRSDVTANIDGTRTQVGIPLALTITVIDTENACAPYANAQVDIWQCNTGGIYSDEGVESTDGETWLRGFQLTDANGQVTFKTIIPGWYQGRTTHIHARVRSKYSTASSTSDGTNTTQIFFEQTFIDDLATSVAPYNTEGTNPTTNASDHVYSGETNGANVLTLTGDNTNGYTASLTIGLPIG